MNKWLDELEWLLESGGYSVVLKNDYETRLDRDFRVAVDRLIAIAEGAHKHMDEPCYPYCPICGGYGKQVGEVDGHGCYETEWAHFDDCPYHEDWKPDGE